MQKDPYENEVFSDEFLNELKKSMNDIVILQFMNMINNKFIKPVIPILTYLKEYCEKSSKTINTLIQVVNYMHNDIDNLKKEVKKLKERNNRYGHHFSKEIRCKRRKTFCKSLQ